MTAGPLPPLSSPGCSAGATGAPAARSRAETDRLVALAVATRSPNDPKGWAHVAARIALLRPDFATLLRCIRRDPPLLAAYFADESRTLPLVTGATPSRRLMIRHAAELAAGRPPSIVDATDDERLRVRLCELALLAGVTAPPTIAAAAEALALRRPEAKAALAFLLFATGRASPQRLPFDDIGAWPERQRRVLFWRTLAFAFHRRTAPFPDPARAFRITLGAGDRALVARLMMPGQFAAAKQAGLGLLVPTVRRAGLPAARWFDISLTLPQLARLTTAEAWTALVRATLGRKAAEAYLMRPPTLRMTTRRFGVDGLLHLYRHFGVRSLFEQSLEHGPRSAKRILKDFARRYPQVLAPERLTRLEAFTADRETFITIVNGCLLGRAPGADADIAGIAAATFETPAPVMRAVVESETGRRLLVALAHFKAKHDVNLMRSVALRGDAPPPAGLDGYLAELGNAFALELAARAKDAGGRLPGKTARRKLFDWFLLHEFGAPRLSPDRLDWARQRLRARAAVRINAALAASGCAQRLEPEDLDALGRRWRDAEPVVTLLARLSDPGRAGAASADAATLVLHTAKAAARGGFMAFKFDDAGGRRQIAFLTDAQSAAWRTSRALARVGGAGPAAREARAKELADRLDADLRRLCAIPASSDCPESLRAEIAELAGEEIKDDPAAVAGRAIAAYVAPERAAACARGCLPDVAARFCGALPGGSDQRNAARMLRALIRIGYADACDGDARRAALEAVRAVEREIPRDLLDGETISKGVVVTAFDCSPRLMLTIGDVVDAGSCLNYLSGARIEALPAYAVDANIQALVSWRLRETHFASARDYRTVLNAFLAGPPVTTAFDGDRLAFRFTIRDGARRAEIETSALGFAHLRQIVRLGRARRGRDDVPGLLAERAYAQPHPLQPLMYANHADILRALSSELGAVDSGPIAFPPSRNPGGVYCDALGGVQPGAYAVP